MKKYLLQIAIFVALLALADLLFYWVNGPTGSGTVLRIVEYLFRSILLFLMFEGLLYGTAFTMRSGKLKILTLTVLPLVLSMHIAHRWMAINTFYSALKRATHRVSPGIWQFDPLLGYSTVPGATGNYMYYIGDSIKGEVPVIIDENGFRVASPALRPQESDKDLFLGCSCTFGDYLPAEKSYAYLTARSLHHNYVNCARSAYGMAQMYQLAEKMLSKDTFVYVFLQLSPWLAQRSMGLTGPTSYGYQPTPYFTGSGTAIQFEPPAFSTLMHKGRGNWRETPRSWTEKMYFTFTDGAKVELHDYYAFKMAGLKIQMGLAPKPTPDNKALERFFYDRMIDLCRKHNATPVILKLRYDAKDCADLLAHVKDRAVIIDLDEPLDSVRKATRLTHQQLFALYHRTATDSTKFDDHPNAFANMLFAEKISATLQQKNTRDSTNQPAR